MKLPAGKGMFLWQTQSISNGTVEAITQAVNDLGLNVVNIKVAHGVYNYNGNLVPLVNSLHDLGVLVFGWQYIFGYNNPLREADRAIARIIELDLDGFEVDAEAGYKNYPESQAAKYMARVRGACKGKDIPLGITSYRFPLYHMELPWKGFVPFCDYYGPQVYWQPYTGPTRELDLSIKQWLEMCDKLGFDDRPFFPAGRAYIGDGYPRPGPPPSELTAYMEHCKAGSNVVCQITGFNFWSMDNLYTHSGGQPRYEAIQQFEWDAISDQEKLDRLWEHHPELHN